MQLTSKQRAILDGKEGGYPAKCMRWLVDWGTVMGARRLVPVDNTHVLLPMPNLMARNAAPGTVEQFADDLHEACTHAVHPRCLCTVDTLFVTFDDLDVPENDPE